MNHKLIILGLVLFPAVVYSQCIEKCPDVVALPKELYNNFQSLRANLNSVEEEVRKDSLISDALHKKFSGCENQPPYSEMIRQVDDALQAAETNRKKAAEAFTEVKDKVRQIIRDAHGRPVEYLYHDPNPVDKLGAVVTITFTIQEDKVVTVSSYYQLSGPVAH